MLRRVAIWAAAIMFGAFAGAASALAIVEYGSRASFTQYGAWTHSRAAGSTAADPYTRAIIARAGLLALSAREALYFTLAEDSEGRPLTETCIYDLVGRELDARWWSVTLYASDHFLAQNDDHAPAIDATRVRASANGTWRARISTVRGNTAHWLSSRNARSGFTLTLRVYNPDRDFAPSAETLPVLETISCAGVQT